MQSDMNMYLQFYPNAISNQRYYGEIGFQSWGENRKAEVPKLSPPFPLPRLEKPKIAGFLRTDLCCCLRERLGFFTRALPKTGNLLLTQTFGKRRRARFNISLYT
jgi:hypothetical protein